MVFKENEEIEPELQCELLLAECKANTGDFYAFREHYAKNVVKKAEALGIELRGGAVANSEFRIYQRLWNKGMRPEDQDYVLKTHLNKAILESSKSEGEEWLYKMVKLERKGHKVDARKSGVIQSALGRTGWLPTSTSATTTKSSGSI